MSNWKQHLTDEESDELIDIAAAKKSLIHRSKKIKDRAYRRMVRSEGKQ